MADAIIAYEDAYRMALEMPSRRWDPDGDDDTFTFPWPLPIDLSFQYDQTIDEQGYHLAGDDGYPVGDLNWFPEMKEDWENGLPGPLTPITTAVEDKNGTNC